MISRSCAQALSLAAWRGWRATSRSGLRYPDANAARHVTAGWRFTAGPPNKADLDLAMIAVGHDEVYFEALGSHAIAPSAIHRLISLLVTRAFASPH